MHLFQNFLSKIFETWGRTTRDNRSLPASSAAALLGFLPPCYSGYQGISLSQVMQKCPDIQPPSPLCVSGYFLEKNVIGRKSTSYKLNTSRIAYAYKESLVYPYVDFEVKGDNYILHNEEYTDVLLWIEKYGLVHIQWLKIALCSFIFVVVPNFMYAHLIWFAFSHKFSTFLARENSDK